MGSNPIWPTMQIDISVTEKEIDAISIEPDGSIKITTKNNVRIILNRKLVKHIESLFI